MRKYTVLFVVLVLVLAFGNVALAHHGGGGGNKPNDPRDLEELTCDNWKEGPLKGNNKVENKLVVKGTVGEYAAINVCSTSGDLQWSGKGFVGEEKSAKVQIKSNTGIKLTVGFDPLKNGSYKIKTKVELKKEDSSWQNAWSDETDKDYKSFTASGTNGKSLQGVAWKEYDVRVTGTLGDIHHQAAGDYKTEVVFTVAKAS